MGMGPRRTFVIYVRPAMPLSRGTELQVDASFGAYTFCNVIDGAYICDCKWGKSGPVDEQNSNYLNGSFSWLL